MRTPTRVKNACYVALALWAQGASADTAFCVANVADLLGALVHYDIGAASGETVTIRIRQGTYDVGNALTRLHGDHAHDDVGLKLLGGYTAGCASRTIDPRNTVLDAGDAPGSGIGIAMRGEGALLVEGLTFTRFTGATSLVDSDGHLVSHGEVLRVSNDDDTQSDEPVYELRQNRFVRNAGQNIVSLWGPSLRFVGNVVGDNTLRTGEWGMALVAAVAFQFSAEVDGHVTATNNTIVNTAGGPGMLITGLSGTSGRNSGRLSEIADNIVWNNATDIVFAESAGHDFPLLANYNLYGTAGGSFPQNPSTDIRTDPRFVDAATGNYRLASNSPAINRGAFLQLQGFPPRDADGGKRIVGSRVDIGAYESAIDDATTAIVTNTGDNGSNASPTPGSLRAAIKAANAASGPFAIRFNLGRGCPHLLSLAAALPDITGDVTIDGTTLAGWSPNDRFGRFNGTLCAFVNGLGRPWALRVPPTAPANARLVVRGLGFAGFSDAAIKLEGGRNHRIWGSQFGAVPLTVANRNAIRVTGNSGGAFIGGYDDEGAVNLIAGSSAEGILLDNAAGGSRLANNVIGYQADGSGDGGNATGVFVYQSKNNVLQYNHIGNSASHGVVLSGAATTDNVLQYNWIGVAPGGGDGPNGGAGVLVNFGANRNTIGAPLSAAWGANIIDRNGGPGVWIAASGGSRNSVLANGLHWNGGLDIDLGQAGPNTNPASGSASGPNLLQAYPVLATAVRDTDHGVAFVTGTLTGAPYAKYRVDLYYGLACSATVPARGAAMMPFAYTTVTAGPTGVTPFTISAPSVIVEAPAGVISATATDAVGNTSEIGNCVTETLDGNFGSAGG